MVELCFVITCHLSSCSLTPLQPTHARNLAFRLQPLKMSADLIQQLNAAACKLEESAKVIQDLIAKKKNKNKYYSKVIEEALLAFQFEKNHALFTRSKRVRHLSILEVKKLTHLAAERLELGKALVKAANPKPKAATKAAAAKTAQKTPAQA